MTTATNAPDTATMFTRTKTASFNLAAATARSIRHTIQSKVPDIELISRKNAIQAVLCAYDDEGMYWPTKKDMIDAINSVRPTFIISADYTNEDD